MVDSVLLILASLICFCAGMLFANRRRVSVTNDAANQIPARTAFLFEGEELIDATPTGKDLLAGLDTFGCDKRNLILLCEDEYPDLEMTWDSLESLESATLEHVTTGVSDLAIARSGERISIRFLYNPNSLGKTVQEDLLAARVQSLSEFMDKLPGMIWRQHSSGQILWANRQYQDASAKLARIQTDDDPAVSQMSLFSHTHATSKHLVGSNESFQHIDSNGQDHWFKVTSIPTDDGDLHIAIDATETVEARKAQTTSLRTFVQIFAQLSIGFAIFDENRQLSIYNPSISELSGLDPVFLTGKPTLLRLVEEMRQKGKTPEPKDFEDLRETIRKIERAAEGGTYESVWTLADGQSLRVTARPYHTGSIALLIEDVSSELALARRYRTEVTLYQDLFELVDKPTFLFSADGRFITNNERVTAKTIGPIGTIGNIFDFLEFLNSKTIPGRKLTIKTYPSRVRPASA
ncbi:PAS fold [Cognatiyoonia sediminum]|uniref:PAS fold n=1 Tax=Cognatiyoonia sediminum TaxID=1508389 RepID=A0A1M5QPJ1_9RHOB|nr:PAS-domain containing protein [Cognatiyoonia sediminum]SHH16032.1 PAS fold [Cognatiyoonia sediminum]